METRKLPDDVTQPAVPFGTSPNLIPSLKQTHYDGSVLKDRYLIEGELGRGGIGVVYLARDTQLLQWRVVIKVLLQDPDNSVSTSWFKKKFEQEIEALVRLDHPGVVGLLDAGVMPDGKPFFVMQNVEGLTLRSWIEKEQQGRPPGQLRADLPPAAEQAILKALAFDQTERYQRARDFSEELARMLSEEEKTAVTGQSRQTRPGEPGSSLENSAPPSAETEVGHPVNPASPTASP